MEPSTTVRIKASQLRRLVEPVLPFTDKGDTLPILEAVLFRSQGGHLYAHATDRYRLGVQRVAVEVPDGLTFVLAAKSIRAILSLYRGTKLHDPDLEVEILAEALRITGAGSLGFAADSHTTWPLVPGEYPSLTGLLRDAIKRAASGTSPAAFNAAYLGDFKQAALHSDGITPVQVWTHENKPAVIRVGEDFIGVLMPVRWANDSAARDLTLDEGWTAVIGATEAVPA